MKALRKVTILALYVGLANCSSVSAQHADANLQNWFADPFFQFTNVVADCPVPLGPYITAAQRAVQEHRRAERGTSCWLVGSCDKPNAYVYDAEIAVALKLVLSQNQLFTHSPMVNSSLWATVQGRIVTIEGCVEGDLATSFGQTLIQTQIETMVSAVPNVLHAVAMIRVSPQTGTGVPVPYKGRP
jgi:hypothetical protein